MLGLDRPITGENNRSLDDVLELAKVPWPGISLEEVQGVSRDPLHLLVDLRFRFAKEVIGQDRQVLHPFAKPRKGDRERIEPIEEVLSEFRALHRGLQIPVRRGDDANAHTPRRDVADRLDLAGLEHAEELALHLERHITDFVEEDRAAVRLLEQADLVRDGSGECSSPMAEQFGFHQRGRQRRAIDGQEWLLAQGGGLLGGPGPLHPPPFRPSPSPRRERKTPHTPNPLIFYYSLFF